MSFYMPDPNPVLFLEMLRLENLKLIVIRHEKRFSVSAANMHD